MAQETLSPANEGSALRTQLEQLTRAISASLSDGAAGHAVGKDFLSLGALVVARRISGSKFTPLSCRLSKIRTIFTSDRNL